MSSADTGRMADAGSLVSLRANSTGCIVLGPLIAGTLVGVSTVLDRLRPADESVKEILETTDGDHAIFPHGDGSALECSFALDGAGDDETVEVRLWGLLPMVPRATGSVKARHWRKDPLCELTLQASTHVGALNTTNGLTAIVPNTARWCDTITVDLDWLKERPWVRGPRNATGVLQTSDNHNVSLLFDGLSYPYYEIEIGGASVGASGVYLAYRFISGL